MPKYSHIDFSPPQSVKNAYKRGIELHENGKTGSGIEASTVSMAKKLSSGSAVSPEWARKGNRFWARNERFLNEPKDSPAYASAMLWGGRPGMSWFRKLYKQMESAEKKASNSGIQANVVKEEDGEWFVFSEKGKRLSKGYPTKEAADKRLQQIEYFKMNRVQCNVLTQVNAGNVMRDDQRGVITLKNVVPIVDDVVMNGGYYQKEDIDISFDTIEDTIAPLGHPTDRNGNFISAKSGSAIQNFYVGAVNKNVTRSANKILMDIEINTKQAEGSKRGKELIDRINNMSASLEPIHVSTGLMLNRVEEPGVSATGESYDWIAKNMDFDHVAILLDEPGAATPEKGVGIFANAKGEKQGDVLWCNLEANESAELINEIAKLKEPEKKSFLDMFAKFMPKGNNKQHANFMPNSQEEEGEMKDFIIKQLLAGNCGKTKEQLEALTSSDLEAMTANAMKGSMSDKDSMDDMKKGSMNGYMEDTDKAMNAMKTEMNAMKGMLNEMKGMFDEFKQGRAANREALVANAAKHTGKDASAFDGMTEEQLKMIAPIASFGLNSAMPQEGGTAAFTLEDTGAQA